MPKHRSKVATRGQKDIRSSLFEELQSRLKITVKGGKTSCDEVLGTHADPHKDCYLTNEE